MVPATCVACPPIVPGVRIGPGDSADVLAMRQPRHAAVPEPENESAPASDRHIHRIGARRNRGIRVERRVIAREAVQYLLELEVAPVLAGSPDRPTVLRGEGIGGRSFGAALHGEISRHLQRSACWANAPNETAAITTTKMPIPRHAFFIGNLRFGKRETRATYPMPQASSRRSNDNKFPICNISYNAIIDIISYRANVKKKGRPRRAAR